MTDDVHQLVLRYRRTGIIVDTNILLLYFVGRFAPAQIERFKRTASFSVEDFKLVEYLLHQFERLLTTPTILAEVSNLSAQFGEPLRSEYFRKFQQEIELLQEEHVRSRDATTTGCFVRLGLTDAGIHFVAQRKSHLVLTSDLKLYLYLQSEKIDVINFNHIRPLGWESLS